MRDDVYNVVKRQILQSLGGSEQARRAALAKLRRGTGKPPGNVPEIWELTIGALPENASPPEEYAVHAALTLFAVHRQGTSIDGLSGGTLGAAVAKLRNGDNDDAITRRFNSTVTSATIAELCAHARSLVQLLRSKGINMDYPKFAQELYVWQFDPEKVRLNWGRDYWRKNMNQKEDSSDE